MFGYENELVYPIFISKQTFEDSLDLLLLIKNNRSHYVYIFNVTLFLCLDFNTCFIKQKIKIKNGSVKVFCSVLVVKMC